MPNYDFKCKICSHLFEEFQSMSEPPLNECPECGGELKRLIGGNFGISFKGSGFYVNDYKKTGPSPSVPSPTPITAPSTTSSETK